MDKASRNHPLSTGQITRNMHITKKRSPGENPHSVVKVIFHDTHIFVTMVRRVHGKATFMCLGFNLLTLLTKKRKV